MILYIILMTLITSAIFSMVRLIDHKEKELYEMIGKVIGLFDN